MEPLKTIIDQKKKMSRAHYITHEFQDYGYRLAEVLGDVRHKALYIKLAKELPRPLLDQARDYALGYYTAKSKAKLFMWKLEQLKKRETQGQRQEK